MKDNLLGSVLADGRWAGQTGGIARYAREILSRLPEVDTFTTGPFPWHPLDSIYTSWILASRRPRIFFSPGFNAPAITGRSVIFTLHDLIHRNWYGRRSRVKREYYDRILRPAARRARSIVTVSEYSRQEIVNWARINPERVVVVPNACSDQFRPSSDKHNPGYPYFLVVGAQKTHKNIDRILEAFSQSGVEKDIRVVFSTPAVRSTIAKVAELKLTDRVVFAGGVKEAELPRYYRGALALLSPSMYEGFGIPILESMACGTPVLGSTATAIPEVAGDAALLVDPYDRDAIGHAMKRLARDCTLRSHLRDAGFKNVARFDWDRSAAQVKKLLEE